MTKPNIRTVNKLIAAKFPGYSLIQEKDYVRIDGPDTHTWQTSGIMVDRVSFLTPDQWLNEVEFAIQEQVHLNAAPPTQTTGNSMKTLFLAQLTLRHNAYMGSVTFTKVIRLIWADDVTEAEHLLKKQYEIQDPYSYSTNIDGASIDAALGRP